MSLRQLGASDSSVSVDLTVVLFGGGEFFSTVGQRIHRSSGIVPIVDSGTVVCHLNQEMAADNSAALGSLTDSINSSSGTAVAKTDAAAIVAPEDNAPAEQYK